MGPTCKLAAVLLLRASAAGPQPVPFVTARGTRLYRGDQPRRFMGANLWYAMNLGCEGAVGCNRARLDRELDRLKARGVSCVRILGASEGPDDEPWRVSPSLQPSAGVFNEQIAGGLDYTLAALERRGMDAMGGGEGAGGRKRATDTTPPISPPV